MCWSDTTISHLVHQGLVLKYHTDTFLKIFTHHIEYQFDTWNWNSPHPLLANQFCQEKKDFHIYLKGKVLGKPTYSPVVRGHIALSEKEVWQNWKGTVSLIFSCPIQFANAYSPVLFFSLAAVGDLEQQGYRLIDPRALPLRLTIFKKEREYRHHG